MLRQRRALEPMVLAIAAAAMMCAVDVHAADPAKSLKNPVPSTSDSVARGEATFQKHCAFCHGPDARGGATVLKGGVRPPSLVDNQWTHGSSDGEIYAVIHDGGGTGSLMKSFKEKVTDREIWDIVNYLRGLAKPGR